MRATGPVVSLSVALVPTLGLAGSGTETSTLTPCARTASVAAARPGEARGLVDPRRFEPEDAALFVPRLLLAGPRWALALVYWPLREGLVLVEEHHVVEHVRDVLYNDARTAGWLPFVTGFPGAGLSGGIRVFHDDLLGHGESLAVSAAYGGLFTQAYRVTFAADHVAGGRLWFDSEVSYEAKPNLYFVGIGAPEEIAGPLPGGALSPYANAVETRFSEQRFLGRFRIGTRHGRPGRILEPGMSVVYNHRRFDQGSRLGGGEISTDRVYETDLIPGFRGGADTVELTLDLVLDYRDHRGRPTDGFYLEAFAGGVPPQAGWQYFHWGAEVATFFELWAKERVLVLRAFVEGVEGDRDQIPFTALPRLGGPYRLRGYRLNRFRDEKAILGTVQYNWHVHQYVTASLFVDAGQVNDDYVDLVLTGDDANWQVGFGGGLRIGSVDTTFLNVDLSYGNQFQILVSTEPLEAFTSRTKQL